MNKSGEIVEESWRILESGQLGRLEEVWATDIEMKGPGASLRGLAQLRPYLEAWFTAFPDLKHQVVSTVDAGDTVTVELRITGTHTGPMRTPKGELPPTGRKVVWEACDVMQIAHGKVSSWHAYVDQISFLAQLGLLPAP